MERFTGKVAIVTGAAGGIGGAAARRLAAEGASVVAVDLTHEGVAETVSTIEAAGGTATGAVADVTQSAEVEAYVNTAVDTFGGVDILFNNAGIEGAVSSLETYPEEMFDKVLAVNVKGVWLGMRHVADAMRMRGGGSIVNTASVAGLIGTPTLIAYGASKHAVVGMTKTAARELAPADIRVNAVCPGVIRTRMMDSIEMNSVPDDPEAYRKTMAEQVPMGRYGRADEVVALVAFLASDEASYITGSIYTVDGGMHGS